MANQWLKARQTKYAAYAATYILIVIAVIVVVNVLADRYNKSYDATANKRYSLSEQTAKIVKGLKQDATITYYNQTTRFREGKDMLSEYANLSPKVQVEVRRSGQGSGSGRGKRAFGNYGTAMVQIGDKKEEAKSMTEEGITGAFIRDLKSNSRTVCFVTGSGEHQIDDSEPRRFFAIQRTSWQKTSMRPKRLIFLQKPEVPSDCTTSGSRRADPRTTCSLKSTPSGNMWRMAGRAFFHARSSAEMGRSEIADNDALTSLLQSWGVTLDKDLILDLNPVGQIFGFGPQVALGKQLQLAADRERDQADRDWVSSGPLYSRSRTATKRVLRNFSILRPRSLATTNLSSARGQRQRSEQ